MASQSSAGSGIAAAVHGSSHVTAASAAPAAAPSASSLQPMHAVAQPQTQQPPPQQQQQPQPSAQQQSQQQQQRSQQQGPVVPTINRAATQAQLERITMKQAYSGTLTSLRAIAHRAAADMERYRLTVGKEQEDECLAYWAAWTAHMAATKTTNERMLAFARATAAATAQYAAAISAASAGIAGVATGEAMASVDATDDGDGGTVNSGAIVAAADAGISRNALTLSAVAASLRDLDAQVVTAAGDLATELSRDVCGDADGPLGRRGDGKHSETRHAASQTARAEGSAPRTLADLCAWYDTVGNEILREGNALTDMLLAVGTAAGEAYTSFETACHGLITGSKLFKGRDLWADELRYRRACRILLAAKARYLHGMAGLFERYRRVEGARGEALALATDRFATVTARVYDRVTSKNVTEAVKGLNTHADVCRYVGARGLARRPRASNNCNTATTGKQRSETLTSSFPHPLSRNRTARLLDEDTRRRISILRAKGSSASAQLQQQASPSQIAAGVHQVGGARVALQQGGGGGYGGYSTVPLGGGGQRAAQHVSAMC